MTMNFLSKWRLFAWGLISSPVWLLAPLVALLGIGGHFLFVTLLLWALVAIYLGPHKLLRCPQCDHSMLSWWKKIPPQDSQPDGTSAAESGSVNNDTAARQVYLLLALFSSQLAATYLGDLHCPHCGHVLYKMRQQ